MKEFDWEETRENYRNRRRSEGATEEQIAEEQIPADKVVWAANQLKMPVLPRASRERTSSGPAKGSAKITLTKEETVHCCRLNMEGFGNSEIATALGITSTTVKRILERNGLKPIDGRSRRYEK